MHAAFQKGSITLEAIVALGLLGILVSTSVQLIANEKDYLLVKIERTRALETANGIIDLLRKTPARVPAALPETDRYESLGEIFYKSDCLKVYGAAVRRPYHSRQIEVQNETVSGLFSEQIRKGRDCNIGKFENFNKSPNIYSLLGTNANPTSLDSLEINGKQYAFVATMGSNRADLWVVDIDADPPQIISQLETGPGIHDLDVAWVGDEAYVFAANYKDKNQLQIIKVSTPAAPILTTEQTLPGVGNSYPQGYSVYYYDKRVLVGTRETAGNELHIYNLENPEKPVHENSLEINHNVHAALATQDKIYAATSADKEEILVFDKDLNKIQGINLATEKQGESDALSIYILGDNILIGKNRIKNGETGLALIQLDKEIPEALEYAPAIENNSHITAVKILGDKWLGAVSEGDHGQILSGEIKNNRLEKGQERVHDSGLVDIDTTDKGFVAMDQKGRLLIWR